MAKITIQQAIDTIISVLGVPYDANTVDTIKVGDPQRQLTGIVTTFLATSDVIARAAAQGANLIITHEPTFYNHEDMTEWLEEDTIYRAKRQLIDRYAMTIWRCHDCMHLTQPDSIVVGLAQRLGWTLDPPTPSSAEAYRILSTGEGILADIGMLQRYCPVATIPPTPLVLLAKQLKGWLGIDSVRVSGPDTLVCRRVGLAVGALPGSLAIATLMRADVDVVVCGEVREWEACEYLRDAAFFGRPKGMIVVGHAASEEEGMAYLAHWLRRLLPGVPIMHLSNAPALRVVT